MAMNRFTEQAQEALARAQEIMHARQQAQLDVEHILLALLQQPDGLPVQIITHLGANIPVLMSKLDDALGKLPSYGANPSMAKGNITPRGNRVFQEAAEEARHLNDEFISTGHLLLAIADEQTGPSAIILHQAGIDRGKIFMILRMLPKEEPPLTEEESQPSDEQPKIDDEQPIIQNHVILEQSEGPKSKLIINPTSLPQPRGFNHGILVTGGRTLFLSGQTALDAEGNMVDPGDVVAQYRQVLDNLKAVVEEAGGEMQDIVKVNIFVRDRNDYLAHLKELGQIHKSFFGAYYPATALFQVSAFFDEEALVEIEGIAVLD